MRRALVVDDDKFMVRTLSDVLRVKGWQVTQAYSGASAVEAARATPFDVVLMDIKMPGMDGVAAFKAMKAEQPSLRVVLMTAYASQDLIAEAENEGVLRIMPKPLNLPALLSLLTGSFDEDRPVLIVDHDAAFLKTLSDLLRVRGFPTVLARNRDEAEYLMSQRRPAAVLLHMNIAAASEGDALFAARAISPPVALILYSGQDAGEMEPGAGAGEGRSRMPTWIHAYLKKPFDVDYVTGMLDAIRSRR
jgi:DNA-binding NtrC family response regulator